MKIKSWSLYSIIGLMASFFYACKDPNEAIIKGYAQNVKDIKTAYLLGPDTIQNVTYGIVDSAKVSNGEFVFKFHQPYPAFYEVLLDGARIDVIAMNGEEVRLKTDLSDSTGAYQVSGSKDSEKLLILRNMQQYHNDKISRIDNAFYNELAKATTWPDSDAVMTKYDLPEEQSRQAYSDTLIRFMDQNSSSITAFLAAMQLDRNRYEQQLIAYAKSAKKLFPENPQVKRFVNEMAVVEPVSVGHKAPDISLTDSKGKTVSLSDYKGKYLMLNFWASWSKPCRHQNPELVRIYNKFNSKGFDILGISLNVEQKNWSTAIATDRLPWRQACEFKRFDGDVVKRYKVRSLPSNFIIDPDGNIVAKNLTTGELEAFLNKTLKR